MDNNFEFVNELNPELMEELGNSKFSKWTYIFREFMKSDQRYCVLTFANTDEKNSCLTSLRSWKSRYNLQITYGNYKPGIKIYIAKA